jgi:uncharacterized protein (TIGR02145 family)
MGLSSGSWTITLKILVEQDQNSRFVSIYLAHICLYVLIFDDMRISFCVLKVLPFVMAVSVNAAPQMGSMADARDGQKYRTIQVGNQTWMVDNLNYKASNSFCYDDNEANCRSQGRLYTWKAAQNACPYGWRVPTDEEWAGLIQSQKGWQKLEKAGIKLSMAGDRRADGVYHYKGESAFFWTATSEGNKFVRYKFNAGKPKHDRATMVDGPAYSLKCVLSDDASGEFDACHSPLMKAVRSGNIAKAEALLKSGKARVNEQCHTENEDEMTSLGAGYEDFSPLGMAIDKGNLKMVKLLLDYGADPNAVDEGGPSQEMRSMLGRAMYKDDLTIVKLLLNEGVQVYYCDMAKGSGVRVDILLYLAEKMDAKDYNRCWGSQTLLDYLEKIPSVAKLLKSRGALPGEKFCSGDPDKDAARDVFELCGD